MAELTILKANGEHEPFSLEKIKRTAMRAQADELLASRVAHEVEQKAYDGISTKEILHLIRNSLAAHSPVVASRYGLKEAILKLGPTGFDFEKYLVYVFRAYGYHAELPPLLQGMCVTHEVDLLIEKDKRRGMVEAKLHHDPIYVGIQVTMATWARFLDLVDAGQIGKCPHLDEVWMVTNGKFSHESLQFGHCKNMILLGWNHPKERPLSAWIDDKHLYPITILYHLSAEEHRMLVDANIILVSQLLEHKPYELQHILHTSEERITELCRVSEGLLK
ncbi:MAG: hypothetical protein KGN01_02245 [Patescibacteria group bacterium]|nr:hypothetical protein [Patescibacteria group bacterium]